MSKATGHRLGIVLSMLFLFFILPTAFGACDYSITVMGGQTITLSATPNTPVEAYEYLWTETGGVTLPSNITAANITFRAPTVNSQYTVTVYVTNKYAPPLTCVDAKTVCINVVGIPSCPLCSGHFCVVNEANAPSCPPQFNYTGIQHTGYEYYYTTLAHSGYSGVDLNLATRSTANYTLDWSKLDQPTATKTTACTMLRFWVEDAADNMIGEPCEKEICLYYNPSAAIGLRY